MKLIIGRFDFHCPFRHVLPKWWPRLVLRWTDERGRRTIGCVRHTRAAWRKLGRA